MLWYNIGRPEILTRSQPFITCPAPKVKLNGSKPMLKQQTNVMVELEKSFPAVLPGIEDGAVY